MRTLHAFMKKEWLEHIRTGRFLILIILFTLLGVMNPAIAKLTPWLLDVLSDTLAESGMTVSSVRVDAMTSWTQFYKNSPTGLIAFVLIESTLFTKEYAGGTLILTLAKGFKRSKIVLAKTVVLSVLWTVCYWLCFWITYGYNAYYWDNGIAQHLFFASACWWMFGLWIIMLVVLFSTMATSNAPVLLGVGGVWLVAHVLNLLPLFKAYTPTMLMQTVLLLSGQDEISSFYKAMVVTALMSVCAFTVSILIFNKKQL